MNSDNVLRIVPQEAAPGKTQIIYGLIPSQNQDVLKTCSPILLPGLEELAAASMGEFEAGHIMFDILYGAKQAYVFYANKGPEIPEDQSRMDFARRIVGNPKPDFAGFAILEPMRQAGFHVYAAYVEPEFRSTNIMQVALAALEKEAAKMGSPYLSLATRVDVAGGLERLGYKVSTANYRKKIKE
ncbi:MAG: hypothetical protein E4G97_02825 [Deltaproteobacteria bacterium]|nr:MAG: hypothetical protein E4G97_02825 [Deltaproteobacteria bacterium]